MSEEHPEDKATGLFADLPELGTERPLLRRLRPDDTGAMFADCSPGEGDA